MPRGRRASRSLSKKYTVYCEGKTEGRYIDGLRRWLAAEKPDVQVRVEPVDVGGGGYREFEKLLRREPDSNCVGRIVMLDYDRYLTQPEEREAFSRLVRLSQESADKRVPVVLVVSNERFEYALCCHDPEYHDEDPGRFLVRAWSYRSAEEIKSDGGIWDKAHFGERGHDVALGHLSARKGVMDYSLRWEPKGMRLRLLKVGHAEGEGFGRFSNLGDLFAALGVD